MHVHEIEARTQVQEGVHACLHTLVGTHVRLQAETRAGIQVLEGVHACLGFEPEEDDGQGDLSDAEDDIGQVPVTSGAGDFEDDDDDYDD